MKKYILTLVTSATVAATSFAAPFLAVGDNAELFVTGQAGVRIDSNIYLSHVAENDVIYSASPGVEFDFGKNSNTQGLVRFTENFVNYGDHSDLNSNLASTAFNGNYDDGKTKGSLYVTYDEFNQNTVDTVNRDYLIRSNLFTAGTSGEVSVSDKSTVAAGLDYRWTDYRTDGFSDSEVVSVPLHYYYEVTPKVDLGLGYRYRASWFQYGNDAFDNFISLAARGEFTPKLTGKVDLGWTRRNFSRASDTSLFGFDAGLRYAATPKTALALNLANDFDTNSQSEQQKNLTVGLTATSAISDVWSVSAGVNFRSINYYRAKDSLGNPAPHSDDFWVCQLGLTYTVNAYVSITGAASYSDYRSGSSALAATNNFTDSVFSLAANFRF